MTRLVVMMMQVLARMSSKLDKTFLRVGDIGMYSLKNMVQAEERVVHPHLRPVQDKQTYLGIFASSF